MSSTNRWPCVDIAIRSTPVLRRRLISSVAGSPIASRVSTLKPARRQIGAELFEVRAIRSASPPTRAASAFEIARRPAVGDVHEQQLGAGQPRQLRDVRQDRAVGGRVLDRDENVGDTSRRSATNVWYSS